MEDGGRIEAGVLWSLVGGISVICQLQIVELIILTELTVVLTPTPTNWPRYLLNLTT